MIGDLKKCTVVGLNDQIDYVLLTVRMQSSISVSELSEVLKGRTVIGLCN